MRFSLILLLGLGTGGCLAMHSGEYRCDENGTCPASLYCVDGLCQDEQPLVYDAGTADGVTLDVLLADAGQRDGDVVDDRRATADVVMVADASQLDSAQLDATQPDTFLLDAALPDTSQPDTSQPDTSLPDTLLPDTSLPDATPPIPPRCCTGPTTCGACPQPLWQIPIVANEDIYLSEMRLWTLPDGGILYAGPRLTQESAVLAVDGVGNIRWEYVNASTDAFCEGVLVDDMRDRVILLCTTIPVHNTYLAAIDLGDKHLLWQQPRDSMDFVIEGEPWLGPDGTVWVTAGPYGEEILHRHSVDGQHVDSFAFPDPPTGSSIQVTDVAYGDDRVAVVQLAYNGTVSYRTWLTLYDTSVWPPGKLWDEVLDAPSRSLLVSSTGQVLVHGQGKVSAFANASLQWETPALWDCGLLSEPRPGEILAIGTSIEADENRRASLVMAMDSLDTGSQQLSEQ